MQRFLVICGIAVILGLFFNAVEGHTQEIPEEEDLGQICGLPPLNTAAVCCLNWDATDMEQTTCEQIMAPTDANICWCTCEGGAPTCGCGDPAIMVLEDQISWFITRGRESLQEVRI